MKSGDASYWWAINRASCAWSETEPEVSWGGSGCDGVTDGWEGVVPPPPVPGSPVCGTEGVCCGTPGRLSLEVKLGLNFQQLFGKECDPLRSALAWLEGVVDLDRNIEEIFPIVLDGFHPS